MLSSTGDVGFQPVNVRQKPNRGRRKSRSIWVLPVEYQDVILRAVVHIRIYTYFENPMLNADEMTMLLVESWSEAQKETGKVVEREEEISAYVSNVYTPCV